MEVRSQAAAPRGHIHAVIAEAEALANHGGVATNEAEQQHICLERAQLQQQPQPQQQPVTLCKDELLFGRYGASRRRWLFATVVLTIDG